MSTTPVTVSSSVSARQGIKSTWSRICILGFDAGGTASDEVLTECASLAVVGTLFGLTSDIYKTAKSVFEQDVDRVFCIRGKLTTVSSETFPEAAAHVLDFKPMHSVTSITNEAAAPVTPVYINVPATTNGHVNTLTGSVFCADSSTPGGNATIAYKYVSDWIALENVLHNNEADIDMLILAESNVNDGHEYGDLSTIITLCETYKWITVLCSGGATVLATFMTLIGWYSSKTVFCVAHRDIATIYSPVGNFAGAIAVRKPWESIFWKPVENVTMASEWTNTEVNTTIEGGKVNAIITKESHYRFSEGFAKQITGDYLYIDITRMENWITKHILSAVTTMMTAVELPYTQSGINTVRNVIANALKYAEDQGAITSGSAIDMPLYADITEADILARELNDVTVTVTLTSHIHTISIGLNIQI